MEEALLEKIDELKKKIMTLEWDRGRNQINFGKTRQLDQYKKELKDLESSEAPEEKLPE